MEDKRNNHTFETCTCPFCDTILDNNSFLQKHIKQFHRDISKVKKEMERNDTFKTENQKLQESDDMKKQSSEEPFVIHSDEGSVTSEDETYTCPYCEGTILKNKTYFM